MCVWVGGVGAWFLYVCHLLKKNHENCDVAKYLKPKSRETEILLEIIV